MALMDSQKEPLYPRRMAEIYTLSGPADESPQDMFTRLQQEAQNRTWGPTGPTPNDAACARQVAPAVYAGAAARVAGVGTGLFGTYKLLKGKGATGVVSLLGAGVLWIAGGAMMNAAAKVFQTCRNKPV